MQSQDTVNNVKLTAMVNYHVGREFACGREIIMEVTGKGGVYTKRPYNGLR